MLIVGRLINGLAVGICSAQVPVYITEIAPPSKRGRLVGSQQWAIVSSINPPRIRFLIDEANAL